MVNVRQFDVILEDGQLTKGTWSSITTSRNAHIFSGILTGQKNEPKEIYVTLRCQPISSYVIPEFHTYRSDFSPDTFNVSSRNAWISIP